MKKEDLLDRKVLFQHVPINKYSVSEGKVKEFSPSGRCIKIDHDWYVLDNVRILEVFTPDERPTMRFT
jgi:hypothetical protein